MFTTTSIIDNLNQSEGLEYKKLCRSLKITKKSDKDKLDIALTALEKLEIINKNKDNEYTFIKNSNHIFAKIRCSSKGYCFAVREKNKEDIYIKENLLNHAWNGDKVLVRIIKEGYRRRSPEGIVDCILERSSQILLSKVEIINNEVYAIPIDDRILTKIKLPKEDKKYTYKPENKNIVKVQIDRFPIGQEEGLGHVIKELPLNNNEELDTDFVLSKSNINKLNKNNVTESKKIDKWKRIDLSDKKSYLFKSWNSKNSPIMPMIQIEEDNDKNTKLWIHTNNIAERVELNNKKSLEIFFNSFESLPLLNNWQNYFSESVKNASEFKLGEKNEAISLCLNLDSDNEITGWSFHLTLVRCSLIVSNDHTEALLSRKSKTRVTSRLLKPIKDFIQDLDKIFEISISFRKRHLLKGNFEIPTPLNKIKSLDEFFIHNPADYSKGFFEPLNKEDCQTFLSPLLHEGNLIWFKHSNQYGLNSAGYISKRLDYINVNEIIKYSEFVGNDIELNEDGNLSFSQIINLCNDNKKRILHKLLINEFKENEVILFSNDSDNDESENPFISPWTIPGYDFTNLINQYCIFNMIINGKKSKKNNVNEINIMESNSWNLVNWEIFNSSISKNIDILFNNFVIDKLNEYKNKVNQYKSNMISIKKVRKAEKLLGKNYSGFILSVQSYGFFVEISELNVEGLVHVSTLNNDWYEYRSRQNLLIGRKSKNSYKVGDEIEVKIIKVDILKYQIDLEIV